MNTLRAATAVEQDFEAENPIWAGPARWSQRQHHRPRRSANRERQSQEQVARLGSQWKTKENLSAPTRRTPDQERPLEWARIARQKTKPAHTSAHERSDLVAAKQRPAYSIEPKLHPNRDWVPRSDRKRTTSETTKEQNNFFIKNWTDLVLKHRSHHSLTLFWLLEWKSSSWLILFIIGNAKWKRRSGKEPHPSRVIFIGLSKRLKDFNASSA
jgi:hypothetical protein